MYAYILLTQHLTTQWPWTEQICHFNVASNRGRKDYFSLESPVFMLYYEVHVLDNLPSKVKICLYIKYTVIWHPQST